MVDKLAPDGAEMAGAEPKSSDMVLGLIRHVGGLSDRVEFERSFKASRGHLSVDRLLMGIDRGEGSGTRDDAIGGAIRGIGMPADLQESFRKSLPEANHVYFGAENDGRSLIFKAYLEFRDRIARQIARRPASAQPFALYTGFKWDATDRSRRAVTQYEWRPSLSSGAVLERVQAIVDPERHSLLNEILLAIVDRTLRVIPPDAIQLLEVREAGNPRSSLDINLYRAGYRISDLQSQLLKLAAHYSIAPARFDALYGRISGERVGHLAAGVDRDERDFLTIYYGGTVIDGASLRSAVVARA
ncbi:MAG TPA: hypothetical protein VFQ16_01575 [Burkholderiaceae bacterium]|nr:hypothetical protein [Burkholderiaceae bacterium]